MDAIRIEPHVDQLRKRREQISMTLRHLKKERAEVERNTEWMSQDAYEKRAQLLSHVRSWYIAEIDEIDKALTHATRSGYGLCAACEERIHEHQSEFCSACAPHKDHEAEL